VFSSGTKTSVLFQQAQGGILHQPLGIHTGMTGDSGYLRFLLGSEMDFHACQCRRASLCCQRSSGPEPALSEAEGFRPGFLGGNLGVSSVCVDPGQRRNRREPGALCYFLVHGDFTSDMLCRP